MHPSTRQPDAAAGSPIVRSITPFLAARDMRATIAFYTTLLGFRVQKTVPEHEPRSSSSTRSTPRPASGARR
jgi:uncharacterized glyoxalase superfamily protein PhnB